MEIHPPPRRSVARIGHVDDHAATLYGVAAFFSASPELQLVRSARTVDELLSDDHGFDVVILDMRLSDGTSLSANVHRLTATGALVLAYTSAESRGLLQEGARAGIVGLVRKSEPPEALIAAVRAALAGEIVTSADWAAALDADDDLPSAGLSAREREVLALYAAGQQADWVARSLGISRETVLDHIKRIRIKYTEVGRTAPSKVHLYQRAVEDGILSQHG